MCALCHFYCGVGRILLHLLQRDEGQDLVEYSLLLAFIGLAGAAFYMSLGDLSNSIWSISNERLASANSAGGS